jgi:phosphatidylserine/phosphatidylglycerophosphate/cardiolipin synthase-like enzyme
MDFIVPCRLVVSPRFPLASFFVRVPPDRRYEVACATDPRLFDSAYTGYRTDANFYSSRGAGLLQAGSPDSTFFIPPEQLARFAGASRIYYALGSYGGRAGRDARFSVGAGALDRAPFIVLAPDFIAAHAGAHRLSFAATARGRSDVYGSPAGGQPLRWGGDAWADDHDTAAARALDTTPGAQLLLPDTDPAKITTTPASVGKDGVLALAPTRGRVEVLIDGKAGFAAMHDAMAAAKDHIFITSWNFDASTRLPSGGGKTKTVGEVLLEAAKRDVAVRVLLSFRQPSIKLGKQTIDILGKGSKEAATVVAELNKLHSNIKALVVEHPFAVQLDKSGPPVRPATIHERTLTVDGSIGFCGGYLFTTSIQDSDQAHKSAKEERHDMQTRLRGPVVGDLELHFATRWNATRKAADPQVKLKTTFDKSATDHAVQFVRTQTDASSNVVVDTVKRVYLEAVKRATRYIYVENQYFRDSAFTAALIDRLRAVKDLRVIVLVPRRPDEENNPFADHALWMQHQAITGLAAADAKRVGVYSLVRRSDSSDIYVHSKLMIVDDAWFIVGSPNINPRSFGLDDEIALAVRDSTLAERLRLELWKEHLGFTDVTTAKDVKLADAGKFVDRFNAAIKDKASRIEKHVPKPGKKIDLDKLGVPKWMRLLFDADRFAVNEPRRTSDGDRTRVAALGATDLDTLQPGAY